jgi:hypothetical protein
VLFVYCPSILELIASAHDPINGPCGKVTCFCSRRKSIPYSIALRLWKVKVDALLGLCGPKVVHVGKPANQGRQGSLVGAGRAISCGQLCHALARGAQLGTMHCPDLPCSSLWTTKLQPVCTARLWTVRLPCITPRKSCIPHAFLAMFARSVSKIPCHLQFPSFLVVLFPCPTSQTLRACNCIADPVKFTVLVANFPHHCPSTLQLVVIPLGDNVILSIQNAA